MQLQFFLLESKRLISQDENGPPSTWNETPLPREISRELQHRKFEYSQISTGLFIITFSGNTKRNFLPNNVSPSSPCPSRVRVSVYVCSACADHLHTVQRALRLPPSSPWLARTRVNYSGSLLLLTTLYYTPYRTYIAAAYNESKIKEILYILLRVAVASSSIIAPPLHSRRSLS